MAAPKLRNGGVPTVSGPKNTATSLALTLPPGTAAGDLLVFQTQGTTNEERWPKLTVKTSSGPVPMAGAEGKDTEALGEQTVAIFYHVATTFTIAFGYVLEASESCSLLAGTVAVEVGTFNEGEPVKAAGVRQSGETACPTPPVAGLTSSAEYLAIAWFAYKSGKVSELTGWALGASEGKMSMLSRAWTGITTTGEPAFTKTGKPVAMTAMVVVQPATGKSVTLEATESVAVAESAARSSAHPRAAGDAAAIAEAATRAAAQTRQAVEPLSVAETAARLAGATRAAGESVAIADTPARAQAHSRASVDALAIAEAPGRSQSQTRGPGDVAAIAEAPSRASSSTRAGVDALTVLEAPGRLTAQARATADGISLLDAGAISRIPLSAAESIVIHDAARVVTIITVTVGPTLARLQILRTQADLQGYSTTTTMTRTRTSTTYQSYV